jgi:hypothetical protein
MKLLIYSSVIFLLSACSSEQRYVCGNEGFIIKNSSATLGQIDNLKYCGKDGTVVTFSSDCKTTVGTVDIFFDTVSLNLRESGNFLSKQCKKVN